MMKQHLENILESEVLAIEAALLTAKSQLQFMGDRSKDAREMIDYALRIVEYRKRGQAANDQQYLDGFAAECKKYGSD